MNKTNIGWTDYTWSPITGCTKGCYYCYASRLANGRLRKFYLANSNVAPDCDPDDPFSPRFWRDRLDGPSTKRAPSKIFVGSMGEIFDPHNPTVWIKAILAVAWVNDWHTFQFLTKQPQRAAEFTFPSNAWVGVTIEEDTLATFHRQLDMVAIKAPMRFISFEPLKGPIPFIPTWADWIIIGAHTGPGAIPPKNAWVQNILNLADKQGIPVFLKDNLSWPYVRKEWPKG